MGLFSKKPSLSETEIEEQLNIIMNLYTNERYEDVLHAARALERQAPGHGSYFLGMLYYTGEGVEEDCQKALMHFQKGTTVNNAVTEFCWQMGGIVLFSDERYAEAAEWFVRAKELGADEDTVLPNLASCWAYLAFEHREKACKTLRMDQLTQTNAVVLNYTTNAQTTFLEVAKTYPESMDPCHWILLGRCAQLLYNMACRGELSMHMTDNNSLSTWLGNSFRMAGGANDQSLHDDMMYNVAMVCDAMDRGGRPLIGEYFRALCGLLDSQLHHSADAFYRVRWHMKRIDELRALDEDAAEIAESCDDIDDLFEKMQKKYDRMVMDMMRARQLPDLTPSYLPEKVPDPQSCAKFMVMFNDAASSHSAPPQKEKKGLFGWLKR